MSKHRSVDTLFAEIDREVEKADRMQRIERRAREAREEHLEAARRVKSQIPRVKIVRASELYEEREVRGKMTRVSNWSPDHHIYGKYKDL
jgi:hypothetical protein